ncbi:DUF2806 domain-containing protein [Pectobacterium brasiliense]|uniref:DUF2806 domain-containing protein n=1 Tax=Pectobacterium brasiliense TaxID=180957 RepID=UPI001969DD97|nr:DUF2806 domain-containing protein [Pectobacterium brasiliense]MBN3343927.1 DUF2806 domain-containing protein [Pectobacterium brasiliense]
MDEPESTMTSLLSEVVSGVPAPVKVSFFKAFSDLLGGVAAVPAAKLRQYAQAIDDTTSARSMAADALAKTSVDKALKDPEMIMAASEIYLPTTLRKVKNRMRVAQIAAENLVKDSANADGGGSEAPDDDWMNSFMRFAEDASSERLQDVFGRILAGQVLRPGAFGLATLRTVSELNQEIADDFTHAWAKNAGDAVDLSSGWQLGDGFMRWKRLSEAGLMASSSSARFSPLFHQEPNDNEIPLWSPILMDDMWLNVHLCDGAESQWNHIDFTRVGRELGSILPKPDYAANIRLVAHNLPRHGVKKIEFLRDGQPTEVIWQFLP